MSNFNEPAFVMTYGKSGSGKTVDCMYSLPNALFIAPPGALKPWKNIIGLPNQPARANNVGTIEEATALLRQEGPKRRWQALVVDDFSLMSDRTHQQAEERGLTKFVFWGYMRKTLMEFRDVAREFGLHIVVNCHIRNPHTDEKKGWIMGGPMLPGVMPEDFPKSVDACLRVVPDENYPRWPFVYSGDGRNAEFVEKTRLGDAITTLPMNLGEILRLEYGMDGPLGIKRAPGMEWQEDVVEKVATALTAMPFLSDGWKETITNTTPGILKKAGGNKLHAVWTLRDIVARAVLRQMKLRGHDDALAAFGR